MKRTAFALCIVLAAALFPPGPQTGHATSIDGPLASFDAELYSLAYDVFLANGNPRDAFLVAEKAVAAHPKDEGWRYRAAKTGEWSGHPVRALDHWFFLATTLSKPDAKQHTVRLARELRDFGKLKRLLEPVLSTADTDYLREYISACESLGLPDDAIAALESRRNGKQGKFVLEQLARLYEATGQPKKAIDALLDLTSRYGATAAVLLKSSSLAYARGDIGAAHNILNKGKNEISPKEYEFWATLCDLDWAMQDFEGSVQASRLLIEQDHPREADYQRLIAAGRNADLKETYRLALEGWRRFTSPSFFYLLLETGTTLKRQSELDLLIREATAKGLLKPLEDSSYYWSLLSQTYRGKGDNAASLRYYREAMRRSPDDGGLASGYIWLLMDLNQRKELRRVLQAWQGREKAFPELYDAFGAAFAHLGEYSRALPFFQARYPRMHNDPSWLSSYADILEQSGNQGTAFLARLNALYMVSKRVKENEKLPVDDRNRLLQDYVRLTMQVKPGDTTNHLVRKIAEGTQNDATRDLVAAWALSTERSDTARLWFWRHYASLRRSSRWVELSLAMEENDRVKIADLLENDLEHVPYRDAVEGAQRTGQRGLAESLAFESGEKFPADYLLYEQIRDLYGSHPAFVRYRLNLSDRSGVGIGENTLTVSQQVTHRWSLLIEGVQTNYATFKSGAIGTTPGNDASGKLGVDYRAEKGSLAFSAGGRNALESFPFFTASAEYRPSSRWKLAVGLNYSAYAEETAPLRIGGAKDMASLSLEHRLGARDILFGQASIHDFRDQKRRNLGGGESLEGEYNHLFTFAYPDYRARVFGGYYDFTRNGIPQGKLLTLIPDGAEPGMNFFIPDSYGQVGIGFSFGEGTRTTYTKEWRAFASTDFIWNSRSDLGWRYNVGFHGPLFGQDKFSISGSQDSGSYGRSELNTILEFGYTYFFN